MLVANRLFLPDSTKALLFDLDGVIINSRKLESPVLDQYLTRLLKRPIKVADSFWNKYFALPLDVFAEMVAKEYQLELSAVSQIEELLNKVRISEEMPLIKGAESLLYQLTNQNFKLALVSNNPQEELLALLERNELKQCFQVVVGIERDLQAKPEPDLYLKALAELGVDADQAMVFEDSAIGAKAASAAGILFSTVGQEIEGEYINYRDFSEINLELFKDQVTRKNIKSTDPFLAHMLEHIFWRTGFGFNLCFPNNYTRFLGSHVAKVLKEELDFNHQSLFQRPVLALIDESITQSSLNSGCKLNFKTDVGGGEDWFVSQRVETLNSGNLLIQFLEGFATEIGTDIELIYSEDPHHAWESIFRSLGSALAETDNNRKIDWRGVAATRKTAESECNLYLDNKTTISIDCQGIDTSGWLELLSQGEEYGFGIDVEFKATYLSSSHVVAEDIGIVFGQACRKLAELGMENEGIKGYGSAIGKHSKFALSFEGRASYREVSNLSKNKLLKQSWSKNILGGIKVEDLDDFFLGFAQGMGATIALSRSKVNDPNQEWLEIFKLFFSSLVELYSVEPARKGLISGTKATVE